MALDRSSFDSWKKGLGKLQSLQNLQVTARLVRVDNGVVSRVTQQFESETFKDFLGWFVDNEFLPVLKREYGDPSGNPSPFMPKIYEGRKQDGTKGFDRFAQSGPGSIAQLTNPLTGQTYTPLSSRPQWQTGFGLLWRALQSHETRETSRGAMVGIGPRSKLFSADLDLRNYTVTRGKATPSKMGSFFLAAEFGTGQFADPIRRSGATKDEAADGSWWFGRRSEESGDWMGAKFAGQKGIHFLYEGDSSTPNPVYGRFLRERALAALDEYLEQKYPRGTFRRAR